MVNLEFKKHRDNYEINVFYSKNSKSHYTNILDKDVNKLAQILIDLMLEGFPIEKAISIYKKKMKKKDWLGF
jgi:type II secretory pathway component PulF